MAFRRHSARCSGQPVRCGASFTRARPMSPCVAEALEGTATQEVAAMTIESNYAMGNVGATVMRPKSSARAARAQSTPPKCRSKLSDREGHHFSPFDWEKQGLCAKSGADGTIRHATGSYHFKVATPKICWYLCWYFEKPNRRKRAWLGLFLERFEPLSTHQNKIRGVCVQAQTPLTFEPPFPIVESYVRLLFRRFH